MARMASTPLMTGSRKSMRVTSGRVLLVKRDGLFASACLRHCLHVWAAIDDGGYADAHEGMIVYDENANFADFIHACVSYL